MHNFTGDSPGPGYYEAPAHYCWTCDGETEVEVTEYLDAYGIAHEPPAGVAVTCPRCKGEGLEPERRPEDDPFFPY